MGLVGVICVEVVGFVFVVLVEEEEVVVVFWIIIIDRRGARCGCGQRRVGLHADRLMGLWILMVCGFGLALYRVWLFLVYSSNGFKCHKYC